MEKEPSAEAATGHNDNPARERDTIVIQLPAIDPELKQLLCDFFPGRALWRMLKDPPPDALEHARNARRERLLAVRSFVDALIEDTDQPRKSPRTRRVEID